MEILLVETEIVEWSQVSDPTTWDGGSAAHEPYPGCPLVPSLTDELLQRSNEVLFADMLEQKARLTAQAEQIGALICECDQLRREVAVVRELLSRLPEDARTDPVQGTGMLDVKTDIDRTIDHIWHNRTTPEQRQKLRVFTERAERVPVGDDAAVGRAIR